jgi:uncharacterized protein YkwD
MDLPGDMAGMATRTVLVFVAALSLMGTTTGVVSAAQLRSSVATVSSPSDASPATIPENSCPARVRQDAPTGIQEQAMLCLTNLARANAGIPPLERTPDLATSADEKANDLLACDEFSHYACDREFTYWISEVGYLSADCWRVGENLAWGTGEYGSVNAIFRAWMRSPNHRANILGDYRQIGIDLEVGSLGDYRGAHVWAQHFGVHCEPQL